jgi:hypothetical protein
VFLPPLLALYRGIFTPIPKFNRGVFTYIQIPIGVFLSPCESISPLIFLQWSASQWLIAPRDIKCTRQRVSLWLIALRYKRCFNRINCSLNRHFYHLLWGCSHLLACGMWWSLYRDVHNEAAPVLDALNMSFAVWLNRITDPPFHTEKINFLRKINEKSSISGRVRASQRGAVIWVGQLTVVWR